MHSGDQLNIDDEDSEITIEETSNEPILSANQLAAKVLQLRMKGKHQEAEILLKKQAETVTANSSLSRNTSHGITKRILTQQDRCQFCFESAARPKHLTVSIGNFAYLMLPPCKPLLQGHCYILPLQHESATRNVGDDVWDDIRNFKKCLITMFRKQNKEMVFLETVLGLSQQCRHCIVECIPLPSEIASAVPLYFKKAIDEAEDEWSQHNAKKLIDTADKGLRGSIPENFPYFYVEFGLDKGFVHVIDNEKEFNPNIGLDVIRGMLGLPEEDMYRRRQFESVEVQRKAVVRFAQDWEPFDWTKDIA